MVAQGGLDPVQIARRLTEALGEPVALRGGPLWMCTGRGGTRVAVSLVAGRPVRAMLLDNASGRPVRLRIVRLARPDQLEDLIAQALRALSPDEWWGRGELGARLPVKDGPRRDGR
jgi:hypothetical protein